MPWKLLADPSGYIFTWLLGYSGGLGSIAGVLIADYWVVRKKQLRLEDLYLPDGGTLRAMELARGRGHAGRLRAGPGGGLRPRPQAALRLRLVRRLRGGLRAPRPADARRPRRRRRHTAAA